MIYNTNLNNVSILNNNNLKYIPTKFILFIKAVRNHYNKFAQKYFLRC